MSTLQQSRCGFCDATVEGYEQRIAFLIADGERIRIGDYVVLDCGCEAMSPDVEVAQQMPGHPARIVDTVRKRTVLQFNDDGPHNHHRQRYCQDQYTLTTLARSTTTPDRT